MNELEDKEPNHCALFSRKADAVLAFIYCKSNWEVFLAEIRAGEPLLRKLHAPGKRQTDKTAQGKQKQQLVFQHVYRSQRAELGPRGQPWEPQAVELASSIPPQRSYH